MNSASIDTTARRPLPRRRAAGYTFVEMIIAVSILSAFMGGIYLTYIRVVKANQYANARLEALRNGRAALISMAEEIKGLTVIGDQGQLISPDVQPQAFGDGKDNDGDGVIDEEFVNGLDDDAGSSGTTTILGNDRHAPLDAAAGLYERPLNVGAVDLGDADIDEDALFGRDFIIFQIPPESATTAEIKTITYAVPTEATDLIDGLTRTLVRQTNIDPDGTGATPPIVGKSPIAFGVLGFDLLFWDSNLPPEEQGWVTSWDSTILDGEKFRLPASVLIRLTLDADPRPAEARPDGTPVEVVTLQTIVNIESVIGSPLYERPVLR
jgi:type II secretory pathway pseudopilin PulG